jgi:hypothetical protein
MGEAFLMNPIEFSQAFSLLAYRFPDVTFVMERPQDKIAYGTVARMGKFRQPPEIQCAAELLNE